MVPLNYKILFNYVVSLNYMVHFNGSLMDPLFKYSLEFIRYPWIQEVQISFHELSPPHITAEDEVAVSERSRS